MFYRELMEYNYLDMLEKNCFLKFFRLVNFLKKKAFSHLFLRDNVWKRT